MAQRIQAYKVQDWRKYEELMREKMNTRQHLVRQKSSLVRCHLDIKPLAFQQSLKMLNNDDDASSKIE